MYDAVIGWVGLTVLVLACGLTLATDVARERLTDSGPSPSRPRRRRHRVLLHAATTVLVVAGLAITGIRVLAPY